MVFLLLKQWIINYLIMARKLVIHLFRNSSPGLLGFQIKLLTITFTATITHTPKSRQINILLSCMCSKRQNNEDDWQPLKPWKENSEVILNFVIEFAQPKLSLSLTVFNSINMSTLETILGKNFTQLHLTKFLKFHSRQYSPNFSRRNVITWSIQDIFQ